MELLPDPPPPGAAPGQWWPPQMLDSGWLKANVGQFDVLHLHFGAESYPARHVAEAVARARAEGVPFVYTVHDLENPQLNDQSGHREMLDAVIPAADAVLTLTEGAAAEISQRWGRVARVIPHPTLMPTGDRFGAVARPHATRIAGLHLRDLRPNIDALRAVATLIDAVGLCRDAGADVRAVVHMNDRVRDDETARWITDLIHASPTTTLLRHPRSSDEELCRELSSLDVCVLPYAHGTHSGWVELCYDLGVPVAGPLVGYIAQQHPDAYESFDRGSANSLAAALMRALAGSGARPGSAERSAIVDERAVERRTQRDRIRADHTDLYRRLTQQVPE